MIPRLLLEGLEIVRAFLEVLPERRVGVVAELGDVRGRHPDIMVHGTCSSSGCFAMTDASMSEIYAIAREAFNGGQRVSK
jgi:hypothetical protein